MQYSFRIRKGILFFILLASAPLHHADGRRYDKCQTPDGREGVCVVKRYCREATIHPLEACDNDDNFCCPIPTTHRSAKPPVFSVSESHDTRNVNSHKYVPSTSQDNAHRSVKHDFQSGNQRPENDHANSGRDSLKNLPDDSPKLLSSSSQGSARPDTSFLNPEIRHNPRNYDIPKNIPKSPQDGDMRSVSRDFPNNQKPVYDYADSGRDSLSNIPTASSKELSPSSTGSRRPITPHLNPVVRQNSTNYDIPKSIPKDSDGDQRSITGSFSNGKQRPVYDHDNPESRLLNLPVHGGRVRFEDPEQLFNDRNKNRRLRPSSDSNVRSTIESSKTDPNTRRNLAGPISSNNTRNANPKQQSSAVEHYPSRHQLEVQKLPSNPRRLKPLHNDGRNDTIDEIVRHDFYPQTQPKVPACGVKPYDLFIAGGENSEAYEWPWMTSIFRRHQGSRPKTFLCGGSLISTKYVLTAAHCFVNNYVVLPASSFVIRLGSHFLDSGEEYTVSDLVIHHNHSGSDFFNDIALIKIASEVYITDKIAPICLPTPDMMTYDFVDRVATVAGWGDTAFRTGGSRALQHVTIPIVSGEECFAAYSRVRGAAFLARGSDHVICAGLREGGKDACLGDSGGPLMLKAVDDRWTIVGIVSLGYKCAEPGYPGVYTRVTHYLSWIHANMKPH